MKVDLDNSRFLRKEGPSKMLSALDRFPDEFIRQGRRVRLGLLPKQSFDNLVVIGMGGSATAGDVVLDWLRDELEIPSVVLREPSVPSFAGPKTLVVAVSYSGETSETLAALRAGNKVGSQLVGIGTGGRLKRLCSGFRAPFVVVEPSVAPRAALGQLIVATVNVLESVGLIRSASAQLRETGAELRVLRERFQATTVTRRNPAKLLAHQLLGRLPVIYSLQRISSVARRFKNQLAENSKEIAKYDVLPESCHNEIEAWNGSLREALPLLIRDGNESAFERSIIDSFRTSIMSVSRLRPVNVRVPSRSGLSRLLAPILFLDYVSVYLAILKGVDPMPTNLIAKYKNLQKHG